MTRACFSIVTYQTGDECPCSRSLSHALSGNSNAHFRYVSRLFACVEQRLFLFLMEMGEGL